MYSNSIFFKGSKSKILYKNKKNLPKGDGLKEVLGNYNLSLETVLIRSKYLEKMDYFFDEDFNLIEERDFFTRFLFFCEIDYVFEPLAKWRIHDESLTQSNISLFGDELLLMSEKYNKIYPDITKKYFNEIKKIEMKAMFRYSQEAWRKGEMKKARLLISKYIFKNTKIFMFFIFTLLPKKIQKYFLTIFIVI